MHPYLMVSEHKIEDGRLHDENIVEREGDFVVFLAPLYVVRKAEKLIELKLEA